MNEQTQALQMALELLAVATFASPELQRQRSVVIDAGLKALATQPQQEPVAQHRNLHSHMMVVAHRAADAVSSKGQKPTSQKEFVRAICTAIQADKNLLAKLTPQPAPMQQEPDCVLVPRDLIGAACSAIDRKRDAPKILEQLRRYTVGDLSTTQPAQPQQEPVAWANPNDLQNFDMKVRANGGPLHTVPLYTSPPVKIN